MIVDGLGVVYHNYGATSWLGRHRIGQLLKLSVVRIVTLLMLIISRWTIKLTKYVHRKEGVGENRY